MNKKNKLLVYETSYSACVEYLKHLQNKVDGVDSLSKLDQREIEDLQVTIKFLKDEIDYIVL